jgi:hypothetical protein
MAEGGGNKRAGDPRPPRPARHDKLLRGVLDDTAARARSCGEVAEKLHAQTQKKLCNSEKNLADMEKMVADLMLQQQNVIAALCRRTKELHEERKRTQRVEGALFCASSDCMNLAGEMMIAGNTFLAFSDRLLFIRRELMHHSVSEKDSAL